MKQILQHEVHTDCLRLRSAILENKMKAGAFLSDAASQLALHAIRLRFPIAFN